MSAETLKARPLDTKSHILDTAQRLVAAQGFSAVGLKEILANAGVPKGSFYHWFASKEAFGAELLAHYFSHYLAEIDGFLLAPRQPARARLAAYWDFWRRNQEQADPHAKCLAVKLGAEVSDMSEDMRLALKTGTSAIIARLAAVIAEGQEDGSISRRRDPHALADMLYQLWMGASVMQKIDQDRSPFAAALAATELLLAAG